MGYPVILKILSRDILHKPDTQGVELNLQHSEDVRQAFENIMTRGPGLQSRSQVRRRNDTAHGAAFRIMS